MGFFNNMIYLLEYFSIFIIMSLSNHICGEIWTCNLALDNKSYVNIDANWRALLNLEIILGGSFFYFQSCTVFYVCSGRCFIPCPVDLCYLYVRNLSSVCTCECVWVWLRLYFWLNAAQCIKVHLACVCSGEQCVCGCVWVWFVVKRFSVLFCCFFCRVFRIFKKHHMLKHVCRLVLS